MSPFSSRRMAAAIVGAVLVAIPSVSVASQTFVFHLSGDQEVPPVPNVASGGCMAVFDDVDELAITCTHDVGGATLIHIHDADRGMNGPVAFDMGDPDSPVAATWSSMSAGAVADLLAGGLYVNVHSGGRPGGAVRGQIVPRTVDMFWFELTPDQQVPPDFSDSKGVCMADLSDDATELQIDCVHDVAQPTDGHIHTGAAGTNGPVVFDFGSGASPLVATAPMTPENVADLAADFLYVNVHSVESDTGEIRGQIVDTAIFTDGFESGDVAAWSLSRP